MNPLVIVSEGMATVQRKSDCIILGIEIAARAWTSRAALQKINVAATQVDEFLQGLLPQDKYKDAGSTSEEGDGYDDVDDTLPLKWLFHPTTTERWNTPNRIFSPFTKMFHEAYQVMEVRLFDIELLESVSLGLTQITGVSIESGGWRLSRRTRIKADEEAKLKAMKNAIRKATEYSRLAGMAEITMVTMDDTPPPPQTVKPTVPLLYVAGGLPSGRKLPVERPEIEVRAYVLTRFHADKSRSAGHVYV